MKKIYISMPMRGRVNDDIAASFEKVKKLAAVLLGEDVTVVNEFVPKSQKPDDIPMRFGVQELGESISLLSLADVAFFVEDYYQFFGCEIERHVCQNYGIPVADFSSRYICPDLYENDRYDRYNSISTKIVDHITTSMNKKLV